MTVEPGSSAFLQVLAFYSPDGRYDDLFTSNYVTLNVLDRLKRLPGTSHGSQSRHRVRQSVQRSRCVPGSPPKRPHPRPNTPLGYRIVDMTDAHDPAAQPESCHTTHGYMGDKARYLARLKRIEGQARGIHRMVDEEQYCIDILTQISALTKALEGVALGLLDDHLEHCVLDAARRGGDDAQIKIKEASDAIARLVRS